MQSRRSRADETPDFLHQLADGGPSATLSLRTCPGTLERFAQRVYSHPLSWWAGIHQLAGMAGLYGERNRRIAQVRSSILSQILHAALNHPRQAVAIIRFYFEHHIRNNTAGVLGRLLGGAFTNYATRGGASVPFRVRVGMGMATSFWRARRGHDRHRAGPT